MGFSIRLAPGVRIRASSRGIRTSLGPRAARVHIGGGRTGVSTGFGPVSFYTSLGGRQPSRTTRGLSTASYQRQLAAAQRQTVQQHRAQQARELGQAFLHILNLHRVDFPPATPPVAPPPAAPDLAAIRSYYRQQATAGISWFHRSRRTQAKGRADAWADAEYQRQLAQAHDQQRQYQQQLDQCWQRLCANDPDTVLQTLEAAFDDNEAPAAAIDVQHSEVSLVILVPPADSVVPERIPTTTQAGNLSLKKLTQSDRADFYTQFIAGQVLVTIRETLAVAPGLTGTRVAALRNDGPDAYGRPHVSCLLAVTITRSALAGVRWDTADALTIINETATEKTINPKPRTRELLPLNLAAEPGLAHLVQSVDLADLTGVG